MDLPLYSASIVGIMYKKVRCVARYENIKKLVILSADISGYFYLLQIKLRWTGEWKRETNRIEGKKNIW